MNYTTNIGLEIHCQLDTESKLFCECSARYFQKYQRTGTSKIKPNMEICPICLGLPGILPVPNLEAIRLCVKLSLALNCEISEEVIFHRKSYTYPDLPKNYQISQFKNAIGSNGYMDLDLNGENKKVTITEVHLEEDPGKLEHEKSDTGIDFNRCGIPLAEIVTDYRDITTSREAQEFVLKLRDIVRDTEVSNGDMEKGSLRVDINISVRPQDEGNYGTKTEIKNLNSIRAAGDAIDAESERQRNLLESGDRVRPATLRWDGYGLSLLRVKEEASDYRYFPDPDLAPIKLDPELIEEIKSQLPEERDELFRRLVEEYALTEDQAEILIFERRLARFFELGVAGTKDAELTYNFLTSTLLPNLQKRNLELKDVSSEKIAQFLRYVKDHNTDKSLVQQALNQSIDQKADPVETIKGLSSKRIGTDETERIVDETIQRLKKDASDDKGNVVDNAVAEFKDIGKSKAVNVIIAAIMREYGRKVDPKDVGKLVNRKIQEMAEA